jgi:phage gp29-like protein
MSKKRKALPRSLQFADFGKTVKPDSSIMTARVIQMNELFSSFMGYMPNPDEVLRDAGEAIGIYREMKSDARIKSLLTVAKTAMLNYPIQLEQGAAPDATMAMVKGALADFPLYGIAKRLVSGMDYGFATVEIVWQEPKAAGDIWRPVDSVLRRPERFRFDGEGRLKYIRYGELIDLYNQDYKWLVWRHDKDAENPYGTSTLKACYWPWKFKKAGAEFWLMATEKFSVPSILALFDCAEDETKVRERAAGLAEMLGRISSGSGAALANIKSAEVISTDGKLSEFKTLMDWCDTQIAYGIVYQSLAVQEAQNGTRAQASVHEDTFLATMKGLARDMTPVLQRLVDWIVELNVGPGAPVPRVAFDLADYADWKAVVEAIDRGIPVSLSALYSRYALPKPADEDDQYIAPQKGSPIGTDISTQASPSDSPVTAASGGASDVQSTALNGAQVTSLVDLAAEVAQGILPIETARAIAAAAFPLVKKEEINRIFDPLSGFSPKEQGSTFADDVKKKNRPPLRLL